MLRTKNTHTRNLWGKEFSVVKEGLSETEIVAYVSELMQRQDHPQALLDLAQQTAISLKEKAREEAEAQATSILSQAQARAQEIDQEAQQTAISLKEKTREEAEAQATTILSQAQARAQEIDQEAKQAALSQFQERVRARSRRFKDRAMELVQEELVGEDGKPGTPPPAPRGRRLSYPEDRGGPSKLEDYAS